MQPPKMPKTPFNAFAIVRDSRRRGGIRVTPVVIETVWEIGAVAAVERITRLQHVLAFDRVFTRAGMKRAGAVREKLRAAREEFSPPAGVAACVSEPEPSANPPSLEMAGALPAGGAQPEWMSRADLA
jgi:hypothetical protein